MHTGLYAVSVIVNIQGTDPSPNFPDGWNKTVSMPTFYLDANVQGIVSESHAKEIATRMFTDLGHAPDNVHVAVCATSRD